MTISTIREQNPTQRRGRMPTIGDLRRDRDDRKAAQITASPETNMRAIVSPHGTHLLSTLPLVATAYVLATRDREAICKVAIFTPTGWAVGAGNSFLFPVPMAPGHSVASFERIKIGFEEDGEGNFVPIVEWNGQPLEADMGCLIIGGAVYAMPVFNLVAPAAVEELCEPCQPVEAAAVDPPGEDPRPGWLERLDDTGGGGCLTGQAGCC